jgi:hypothetical protein
MALRKKVCEAVTTKDMFSLMLGTFAQAYWFGAGLVKDIGLVRELCWLCLGLPGRNDQYAVVGPAGDYSC